MPSAKARDFQRVAIAIGFFLKRQTGSHEQWEHVDGRTLTVPIHGGRDIGLPLFLKILRQLGVTLEQFQKLRLEARVPILLESKAR
jgi:predicted RNA binding protein YcfA (HicA-like mRNA interferase family)